LNQRIGDHRLLSRQESRGEGLPEPAVEGNPVKVLLKSHKKKNC